MARTSILGLACVCLWGCSSTERGASDTNDSSADTATGEATSEDSAADSSVAAETDVPDPETATETASDSDVVDGDDAEGTPPDTVLGQINVIEWMPGVMGQGRELHAHAVLSAEAYDTGLYDPVAWIDQEHLVPHFLYDGDGAFVWPTIGAWSDATDLPEFDLPGDALDVGPYVKLGTALVCNRDEDLLTATNVPLYAAAIEDGITRAEDSASRALALEIPGGPDVAAVTIPDAVTLPEALVLISPDPLRPMPLRAGVDFVLEWKPAALTAGPPPAVFISLRTRDDFIVIGTEDTGYFNVTEYLWDEAPFAAYFLDFEQLTDVTMHRAQWSKVQLPEGIVWAIASSRQHLVPWWPAAVTVVPSTWPVGDTLDVTVAIFDQHLDPDTLGVKLDPPLEVESWAVEDPLGNYLKLRVHVPPGTATDWYGLHLVRKDPPPRGSNDPVLVPLVDLPRAGRVVRDLPSAGDCASALDEGSVADGLYISTDGGLDAAGFSGASACPGGSPPGREQVIPLTLEAGQRVTISAARGGDSPVALYLVDACGDQAPVTTCALGPAHGDPSRLTYRAHANETVLAVVDSLASPSALPSEMYVEVRRTPADPFTLTPDEAQEGASRDFDLQSFVGDVTGSATLDLGPGITVDSLTPTTPPSAHATVHATIGTLPADWTGAARLTLDGQAYQVSRPIDVRRVRAGALSCDDADDAPALTPGRFAGDSGAGVDLLGDVVRGCSGTEGRAVLYRVDVPASHTLRAQVRADWRPVVYVVDSCDTDTSLSCSNVGADRAPAFLRWVAPPSPTTVYLVVDGEGPTDMGPFVLDLEVAL